MSDNSIRPLDDNDKQLLGMSSTDETSLIHEVMESFGLKIVQIDRATVGNNNSCFIVTVSSGTANQQKLGYTAGTFAFPPLSKDETRRVVFTTAQLKEDMDAALMSANKVAAMKLVHDAGGYASQLTPHVYGWSDGKESGVAAGKSWCLMEYMPGVILFKLWDDLSNAKKLEVVRRIAPIIVSLQKVSVPESLNPYGAFTFENPRVDSSVVVGETCFHYGGPFRHVRDLYAGQILQQWDAVVNKAPRLNKWSGSNVTLRSGRQLDLSEALEELIAIVQEDGEKWREMTRGFEVPPGLIHGDFMELNFLVDPSSLEFTALLDFEFAQAGPPIDEYFQSLPSQDMIFLGDRPSMRGGDGAAKRDLLLQGATLPPDANEDLKQSYAYISAFREAGVFGPWSLNPEVLKRQAGLYWFGYELCNGPLQRETFWTGTDDRSVKRREGMLKEVRENLERDVKMWLD